jgi:cytochrome c oxidase subunit II
MNSSNILPLIPEMASTQAVRFEWLFWYLTLTTAVVGLGVYAALAYFCVRYRRGATSGSTPRILGSHRLEIAWTVAPLMIFITYFAWGAYVFNHAMQAPPDATEIYVIGKQWMWKAQYPNGQRVIIGGNPANMSEEDRKSIGRLVVPINKPVKLQMISEDVIHDFGLPAFRIKKDVLPGRYTSMWFQATKLGEYHIFCDQFCGTWHSLMVGKVAVVSQSDYEDWLSGHKPLQSSGNPADGTLAMEGRQLFLKLQCSNCHEAGGNGRAPVLEDLYGKEVTLRGGGKEIRDAAYIMESILRPKLKVREGWEPVMPSYEGQVSAEDLTKLVAYIRSMKIGDTPKRTENFPVPVGAPTVVSPKGGNN